MTNPIQFRRRTLTAVVVTAAALLTVLPGGPAGASAAEPNGYQAMSPQQAAAFTRGAKQTMGLSDAQVRMLLNDATAWRYTATSANVTVHVANAAPLAAAAVPCKTVSAKAEWKDVLGNVLWRFTSRQYFCYNGVRVGNGSGQQPPPPATSHYTNPTASLAGWSYDGLTVAEQHWYTLNGSTRGGFHSTREARWKYCPVRLPLCLPSQYANIQIWVHYNGTYDARPRIHT
jgi:hypothetical protein